MRYEGATRRRLRQARRLSAASARRAAWGAPIVPAYWWDGHPNFGDALTPWLLPRYGLVPIYREPRAAAFVGAGSLLEFLPPAFSGVVWGTGLMNDAARPLPRAEVIAVRGPLTAERIGARGEPVYGDPGLLVARHVPRPAGDGAIVVVPHGHHRSHAGLAGMVGAESRARVVNVHQGAARAVRRIAAGSVVVTTSLHGLITADAYGIPAVWTTLDPPLTGGEFKFRDYEAAVTPGRSRYAAFDDAGSLDDLARQAVTADPSIVAALGDGLEAALAEVGAVGHGSFPLGVLPAMFAPEPRNERG